MTGAGPGAGRDVGPGAEADVEAAVAGLRTAAAVRTRCAELYRAALAGDLLHVTVDASAWDRVLAETAGQVRRTHPSGPIPIHGRLNHLRGEGWDLAADLVAGAGPHLLDAVVVSVLVDAGAGPGWVVEDPVAGRLGRSEGLAVAAHRAVASGLLSGGGRPYAVDADGLAGLSEAAFARAFQVRPDNPLVGVDGRVALLRRLGAILAGRGQPTVWHLLRHDLLHDDLLHDGRGHDGRVAAGALLSWVLTALADLWPSPIELGGHGLGDTWAHPRAGGTGPGAGLVPFHKLAQWLTYSLIEPLDHLGVVVTDVHELTGLAEYRNGGALIDLGLVVLRGGTPPAPLPVGHPLVVEWRAVTVAALDEVRDRLDAHLPERRRGLTMGELLEAGTWPLGRRLALARDPAGTPPVPIDSDGTVF
jgi:hypothetical protein